MRVPPVSQSFCGSFENGVLGWARWLFGSGYWDTFGGF